MIRYRPAVRCISYENVKFVANYLVTILKDTFLGEMKVKVHQKDLFLNQSSFDLPDDFSCYLNLFADTYFFSFL